MKNVFSLACEILLPEFTMKQRDVDDLYDAADRVYDEHKQEISDAYADGKSVGGMGLGAGLCPHGYRDDERAAWLRGFNDGAAELLTDRRAA